MWPRDLQFLDHYTRCSILPRRHLPNILLDYRLLLHTAYRQPE